MLFDAFFKGISANALAHKSTQRILFCDTASGGGWTTAHLYCTFFMTANLWDAPLPVINFYLKYP